MPEEEKKPCTPCQQAASIALQKLCEQSGDSEQCAIIAAKVKSGEMKPEEFMAFIRAHLSPDQIHTAVKEAADEVQKKQEAPRA